MDIHNFFNRYVVGKTFHLTGSLYDVQASVTSCHYKPWECGVVVRVEFSGSAMSLSFVDPFWESVEGGEFNQRAVVLTNLDIKEYMEIRDMTAITDNLTNQLSRILQYVNLYDEVELLY